MKKKVLYLQEISPFNDWFIVECGKTRREIEAFAKKHFTNDTLKRFRNSLDGSFSNEKDTNGRVHYDTSNTVWVLEFKEIRDDWKFYDTLLHEVVHIVDIVSRRFSIENEFEFRAYLTENLFRSIRKKIS